MLFLTWISSAFASGFGFIAADTTKKYAQLAAGIVALIALAGVFKAAIDSVLASISAAAPTGAIAFGVSLLPSNTVACLTAVFVSLIASAVYKWQRSFIIAKINGG